MYRRSRTATQGTPSIVLVCPVTVTTSRVGFPSFTPVYTQRVPRNSGNQGLSTYVLKLDGGGIDGRPPASAVRACSTSAATATTIALSDRICVFMLCPSSVGSTVAGAPTSRCGRGSFYSVLIRDLPCRE